MLDPAVSKHVCPPPLPSARITPSCPTFAGILYLICVQELHEHLKGLRLGLSDGHFQQWLQSAQLDIPTNPILLACAVPLFFNVLL